MAITVITLVISRYVFNFGSIAVQESIIYMHAMVFLICLTFTAQNDGHVRVDIFYRSWSATQKTWINALGHIVFLIPFSMFMVFISWEYVLQSWGWQPYTKIWSIKEVSANPGGLPFVYLLKSLMPLSGTLLLMYALSDFAQQIIHICCHSVVNSDGNSDETNMKANS